MHELGITQELVRVAIAQAQGATVQRLTLEVGALSGISTEAIAFCFGPCVAGTPLAGAQLEIAIVPGRARCGDCGAAFPVTDVIGLCPHCDGVDWTLEQGQDLILKTLEIVPCV
ncbi:MAG TPA: hydrogenase maturation nickel metallochaperone HypA [Coleofasciculaceae cyanobacterium]